MEKLQRWAALLLALCALIVLGYWLRGWMTRDRCLDNGGRWNDQFEYCERLLGPEEVDGNR